MSIGQQDGGALWLHPDDDLAPNRPGETLHGRLAALGASARARGAAVRLLGLGDEVGELRRTLEAEQLVGEELERLTEGGWRVVHSVLLPGGPVLSHLLAGPGGVFCVRTVHARRARFHPEGEAPRPGRSRPGGGPLLAALRSQARRAAGALGTACGFPIEVRPVLVLVAAADGDTGRPVDGVRVLREHEVRGLGGLGGELKSADVVTLHTAARDRRTWRTA